MKKNRMKKSWKTKKLILFMSFVLFSFLVCSVINYFITIRIVGSERKEINQAILRQIISNVESNILDIDRIAGEIIEDLDYIRFANSSKEELSAFEVFRIQKKIQAETGKNHYIDSICLYAPKINKALTNLEYVPAADLFDEEWLEECSTERKYFIHKQHVELDNKNKVLNLSVVKQFRGDKENHGYVIINVNPILFKESFALDGIEDFMNLRITDKDNLVIYDTGDKQYFLEEIFFDYFNGAEKKAFSNIKIENDTYYSYYKHSDNLGLNFFILIPRYIILVKYYPIVYFMLIYVAVFLAVIFIHLKRIERTTLLPVDNFVEGISSYVECNYNDVSYDDLESLYGVIIENDQRMKKQISSSFLALRWRLLMEILGGSKKNFDDFVSQIKLLQIPMHPSNFVVMVVEIDRRKELLFSGYEGSVSVYTDIIFHETERITDNESVKSASIKMRDDNVVCIFSFLDDDFEKNIAKVMTYASILKSNISAKIGEDISIGIGGYYADFINISASYQEAIIALDRKFLFGKGSIISIEDIRFPVGTDVSGILKQIELLKSVGIEKLDKNVCDVFDDIFEHNVDYEVFHMLVIQIILAIFDNKNVSDYKENIMTSDMYNNVYQNVNQFEVLQDTKDYILKLIEDIKKNIVSASKGDSNNERIIGDVVTYIHKHYANPELSLNMVSTEIGYNLSYISREFKKIKGINFIDYLIEYRIKRAKELLLNSNEKISDISTMVGYTNANSFMRIFKQYMGVTPTVYRNNKSESNKE